MSIEEFMSLKKGQKIIRDTEILTFKSYSYLGGDNGGYVEFLDVNNKMTLIHCFDFENFEYV